MATRPGPARPIASIEPSITNGNSKPPLLLKKPFDQCTVAIATSMEPIPSSGPAGPIPAVTAAAMAEEARAELETGRIHPTGFGLLRERISALRAELAALVGAEPAAAALTQGTTAGMNIAVAGLDWKPGDEVV